MFSSSKFQLSLFLMSTKSYLKFRTIKGTPQKWVGFGKPLLLDVDTKTSYIRAIEALHLQLDPGSRTLAAQDFRHTSQAEDEKVADFIRWLECAFNVGCGREGMQAETRDNSSTWSATGWAKA